MQNILEKIGVSFNAVHVLGGIEELLSTYSLNAPKDFVGFYKKHDGWRITNPDLQLVYRFPKRFGTRESIEFDCLLPIEDIFLNIESRQGVAIPEGTIPFIDAQEGDVVISLREDSFGKVYFCEGNPTPEQMPESSFEVAMSGFSPDGKIPGIVVELAGSFSGFLEQLEVEEW